MNIELDPGQLKAIDNLRNGSILNGGVGSGKSRTALAYFVTKVCAGQLKINGEGAVGPMLESRDLYIITTAKKRQSLEWEKEAADIGLSRKRDCSFEGVKVIVDSWNNIQKYVDVENAMFFFDEQRAVGYGSWVQALIKISKRNQWIMLSGTPGDSYIELMPVFIANGFYKNKTDFTKQHVVWSTWSKFPKIDRYVETGILEKHRRRIMVDLPYYSHAKRHIQTIPVVYDEELFRRVTKDRWHIYEKRPIRDIGEMFIVMRKLVNSDKSRVDAIIELMHKHPRLIVFYNHNHELDSLRTLGSTVGVPMAEWNGHKHEDLPEGDSWLYLVQYTAGAEGWNCITTDATVFYSLNYSYKLNEQAKGRIDRRNTPYKDLYYYILRSNSMIDKAIQKALLTKQSFNEKAAYKKLFKDEPWDDPFEAKYKHIKEL